MIIAENDNWKNNQETGDRGDRHSRRATTLEAALIVTLTAGAYTVIERGKSNTTGVGLA